MCVGVWVNAFVFRKRVDTIRYDTDRKERFGLEER